MKKNMLFALFLFTVFVNGLFAQSYHIKLKVNHLPDTPVALGQLKGDKFSSIDSLIAIKGEVTFSLSANNPTGVYRLMLGQTVFAQVMHEAPQQLDFIFNKENVDLQTDFNAPLDSVKVLQSAENTVWFDFMKKEKTYQKRQGDLVMQINHFQKILDDTYYTESKRTEIINTYNRIQKDRQELITSIANEYSQLYAAKLIQLYQMPFLDGNSSEPDRHNTFKVTYFNQLDFTDETLMRSPVYTKKVFEYIMVYGKKGLSREAQEQEFKKAIAVVLEKTSQNEHVSEFIVDYLMRGFEQLGLNNLLAFIADFYKPPPGCLDDNNTLQRRLAFQKMKTGTKVPDFSLPDSDGKMITLSDFTNDYKLILFWATWCPHCVELLPQLKQWYMNKGLDLEVIAVSIDSIPGAWRSFLEDGDYPWINCNETNMWEGEVATAYNLYATPTFFLVDERNRILAKPMNFNDFLEALPGI